MRRRLLPQCRRRPVEQVPLGPPCRRPRPRSSPTSTTLPRSPSTPTPSTPSSPMAWRCCSSRWPPRACWSRTTRCSPRCACESMRRSPKPSSSAPSSSPAAHARRTDRPCPAASPAANDSIQSGERERERMLLGSAALLFFLLSSSLLVAGSRWGEAAVVASAPLGLVGSGGVVLHRCCPPHEGLGG